MKITKVGVVAMVLFVAAVVVGANAQEKAATEKTTTTKSTAAKASSGAKSGQIIGEVVDPACWIVNGAKGETHKECAIACAKSGQTLAILERKTNKLYLLVTERPGENPNTALMDFIGQTILVKGKVYSRQGTVGIQVASVEPAPKK